MSKHTKVWLVTAAFLILLGCILFGGIMTMLKWDFTKLSTAKFETNNYDINEEFKNISIITDTADIVFIPTDSSKTLVVCYEQKNAKHLVYSANNLLTIEIKDERKWYEYIGINFGSPKITVYIPQGRYEALTINSSTGDIEIPNTFSFESIDIAESTGNVTNYASATELIKIKTDTGNILSESISVKKIDLSVSTGKVALYDVSCKEDIKIKVSTGKSSITNTTCKSFTSSGSTGDISLKSLIAAENLSINRSTGDVKFDGCDASEIFIKTDTGSVMGNLLSDKVFITHTDTGSVNVPKSVNGGKCKISTNTGDIKIEIK